MWYGAGTVDCMYQTKINIFIVIRCQMDVLYAILKFVISCVGILTTFQEHFHTQ
jgi:hypothetical protein